ncbi:unnamed protein product [Dracunculus medinensis]|uniref:Uncharacterized protein n=1 Tax=Dracunculus medinensis TaxID=318479 RepID=A0A0N4U9Y5_DRAME|nr:unnamed protein product [Dracunculus medinensis]
MNSIQEVKRNVLHDYIATFVKFSMFMIPQIVPLNKWT